MLLIMVIQNSQYEGGAWLRILNTLTETVQMITMAMWQRRVIMGAKIIKAIRIRIRMTILEAEIMVLVEVMAIFAGETMAHVGEVLACAAATMALKEGVKGRYQPGFGM